MVNALKVGGRKPQLHSIPNDTEAPLARELASGALNHFELLE